MKTLILLACAIFSVNAYGVNSILGKWKDKSAPSSHKYEFKKNQDFIYTYNWNDRGLPKSRTKKGVWEIGSWVVTKPDGNKQSCDLTIYADTNECCFSFKFIANNLILTNRYKTESYIPMCENRVLVKDK